MAKKFEQGISLTNEFFHSKKFYNLKREAETNALEKRKKIEERINEQKELGKDIESQILLTTMAEKRGITHIRGGQTSAGYGLEIGPRGGKKYKEFKKLR